MKKLLRAAAITVVSVCTAYALYKLATFKRYFTSTNKHTYNGSLDKYEDDLYSEDD